MCSQPTPPALGGPGPALGIPVAFPPAPAGPTVVVFTCNWSSYSALEAAGLSALSNPGQQTTYSAQARPLKVMCLGEVSPGLILKAFEKGADGVLLLACPPDECHFEFGNRRAEEVFAQARSMAALLGIDDRQLRLDWVGAGQGQDLVAKVQAFCAGLPALGHTGPVPANRPAPGERA
jgi:coenzyme F420-reducing hydrogenase delta subunit